MLNKHASMYRSVVSRLSLPELTGLYDRSKEHPVLCKLIEEQIDSRLASTLTAERITAVNSTYVGEGVFVAARI
jgi:hypothetical protein